MVFNWPKPKLTVSRKIGIGTDTPSTELDVIGSISATNLTLTGNLQLGPLSVEEFSNDGNLADNSSSAIPTEQAVKTYVDAQINQVNNDLKIKASLNGESNQDFNTRNLSVRGDLKVSGNLEVQGNVIARDTEHIAGNVSLGDEDRDRITITGEINSGHSSGALPINSPLEVRGALKLAGSGSKTLLFYHTNESGKPIGGDGFRFRYDRNFFGSNLDTLVIEKTDSNDSNPDGGIAFVNTGKDGIVKTALVIRGDSSVGIGTTNPRAKLEVSGDVYATGKLSSQNGQVRRDFLTWNTNRTTSIPVHIKTNIKKGSNVMYRIAVEGYSFKTSAVINSDVVGYAFGNSDKIENPQTNDYADGVEISQYYSANGFVVIKLTTRNTHCMGFSVSAWFTNPMGTGFDITATVHHQAADL
ncbi:MAG: hypothetical protein AB4057_05865 [Crocosphaera sp.]